MAIVTVWEILAAGFWGGLLALERRAFLQAMISRPLVAATAMGILLDDVRAGLFVGMVLELFHLGSANLGAALPENDTLAATSASAAAAMMAHTSGGGSTPALWTIALLVFAGLGRLGRKLDRALEPYSGRLARKALISAESGDLRRAVRQNLWGMWPHFVVYGAITSLCAGLGAWLGPLVARIPLDWLRGLAWAYPAMGSVAAAIAVRGSHARRAPYIATLTACVVVFSWIGVELWEAR